MADHRCAVECGACGGRLRSHMAPRRGQAQQDRTGQDRAGQDKGVKGRINTKVSVETQLGRVRSRAWGI